MDDQPCPDSLPQFCALRLRRDQVPPPARTSRLHRARVDDWRRSDRGHDSGPADLKGGLQPSPGAQPMIGRVRFALGVGLLCTGWGVGCASRELDVGSDDGGRPVGATPAGASPRAPGGSLPESGPDDAQTPPAVKWGKDASSSGAPGPPLPDATVPWDAGASLDASDGSKGSRSQAYLGSFVDFVPPYGGSTTMEM